MKTRKFKDILKNMGSTIYHLGKWVSIVVAAISIIVNIVLVIILLTANGGGSLKNKLMGEKNVYITPPDASGFIGYQANKNSQHCVFMKREAFKINNEWHYVGYAFREYCYGMDKVRLEDFPDAVYDHIKERQKNQSKEINDRLKKILK